MSIELDELSGLMVGAQERPSLSDLLDFYQPAWMRDALCREHPELDFFPPVGKPTAPAKAICGGCLVRAECLAYALEHECVGVWAGRCVKASTRSRCSPCSPTATLPERSRQ